jgi:hypothetical protein
VIIALIPGHGNRQTRTGAAQYHPGAVSGDMVEAVLVRQLADEIQRRAPKTVQIFDEPTPGGPLRSYTARTRAAHRWLGHSGLVLHLHCNGGAPSTPTRSPWPTRDPSWGHVEPKSCARPSPSAPTLQRLAPIKPMLAARPVWANAANLVGMSWRAPAGVCGVLLEWGFVDQPTAGEVYSRAAMVEVAEAIADLTR